VAHLDHEARLECAIRSPARGREPGGPADAPGRPGGRARFPVAHLGHRGTPECDQRRHGDGRDTARVGRHPSIRPWFAAPRGAQLL